MTRAPYFALIDGGKQVSGQILDSFLNKCTPPSAVAMIGQTLYHTLGTCDGSTTTRDPYNKVFQINIWDLSGRTPVITLSKEYLMSNAEYRKGINYLPQVVFTPDVRRFYMVLATPVLPKRLAMMPTCILKYQMPFNPANPELS